MKLKVGPIQIFVSDTEKAKDWYKKILGMKLVKEYQDFKCILMKFGKTEFDIGVPNTSWGQGWDKVKVGGRTAIFFESESIEEDWEELKRRGVKIVEELSKRPWGEMKAVFTDPDGNEFNIVEAEK